MPALRSDGDGTASGGHRSPEWRGFGAGQQLGKTRFLPVHLPACGESPLGGSPAGRGPEGLWVQAPQLAGPDSPRF